MKSCYNPLAFLLVVFLIAHSQASVTVIEDSARLAEPTVNSAEVTDKMIEGAVRDIKADRYSIAISSLSKVLNIDSMNSKALYYRAQAKNAIRNLQGALNDIDLAIKYETDNPQMFLVRRLIDSRIGHHAQAAIDCSRLIALRNSNREYYLWRAQHYVLSEQIDLAEANYEEYYDRISPKEENSQDDIRKTLKELRKPNGPTVFASAWKAGQTAYIAWEKQDWTAMAERIQSGDLKKFKSRFLVAAKAQSSIDYDYFMINGVSYNKSELSNMSPQMYFVFQMKLLNRKQSPYHKQFDIRYNDVSELIIKGKNKALLKSRLKFGIQVGDENMVVQDKMKLENGIWKMKLPKLFMLVANGIYNKALEFD